MLSSFGFASLWVLASFCWQDLGMQRRSWLWEASRLYPFPFHYVYIHSREESLSPCLAHKLKCCADRVLLLPSLHHCSCLGVEQHHYWHPSGLKVVGMGSFSIARDAGQINSELYLKLLFRLKKKSLYLTVKLNFWKEKQRHVMHKLFQII